MKVEVSIVARLALSRLHVIVSLDGYELCGPIFGQIFIEICAQGIEENMVHNNTYMRERHSCFHLPGIIDLWKIMHSHFVR
jgi:hypothetical protein